MWHDEFDDNNPYVGSFDNPDERSSTQEPDTPSDRQESTKPKRTSQDRSSPGKTSSVDSDDEDYNRARRKGFNSRIEQLLYDNQDLNIEITEAIRNPDGGGPYIVYTIRTGDLTVRRRYSDFWSLREALIRLHPTLIIPPIPEKQTVADYAANPTSARQDQHMIEYRKRMLAVFLNRCRKMKEVVVDGVWWRFLDPNASWNEVLNSAPLSGIPKSIMKAPPLDPSNPSAAHSFLPVPSNSAKLKGVNGAAPPNAFEGAPGAQVFRRFPPDSANLSEQQLDPYFVSFEQSVKELEQLLTGPMEKVNRRLLNHLSTMGADLSDLGARLNAFALNEPSLTLSSAIERSGQAVDTTYIATEELSTSLGSKFAEPMRENAQFAGVVRSVLRYRILKRVQQEMTQDDLQKKQELLSQLECSEAEAKRIDQYLSNSQHLQSPISAASTSNDPSHSSRKSSTNSIEDTASIDSDFPPTHDHNLPSASTGHSGGSPPGHRKLSSTNSIASRIFGPIRHAMQGVVDVDPERTRRDTIGKTRESIVQLEQAKEVAARDVKEAGAAILKDLKRFQADKEEDLKRYMIAFAEAQIVWAQKGKQAWQDAQHEIIKVEEV